jgi:RNase H-like domain found in reverse transcriptase
MSKFADLITKDSDKCSPPWSENHQLAFEAIKALVVSRECLMTIDLKLMPDYKIFVTMDASDKGSRAVLSFGKTWESAGPIALESRTFKGAQLHYPIHGKEMLAIIRALDKWHVDLLGVSFLIYTDHKTLEIFDNQQDLSRRQVRWMEFMSQFDMKIIYLKGKDNIVADSLSRLPSGTSTTTKAEGTYIFCPDDDESGEICSIYCPSPLTWDLAETLSELDLRSHDDQSVNVCSTMSISADKTFLDKIKASYQEDNWVTKTVTTFCFTLLLLFNFYLCNFLDFRT